MNFSFRVCSPRIRFCHEVCVRRRVLLVLAPVLLCVPTRAQLPNHLSRARSAEARAMASMVRQGVLRDAAAGDVHPNESISRGEFVVAIERMFALRPPAQEHVFPDVTRGSAEYGAIQAVAPFLGRQVRCPGCALTTTLGVSQPVDRLEAAVTLTNILLMQRKITLVGQRGAREGRGRSAATAGGLATYIATAKRAGLVRGSSSRLMTAPTDFTRADLALMLQGVQERYRIPKRSSSQ